MSDENRHVEVDPESRRIHTHRLMLRPWHIDDEIAACAIYGAREVARWLCPALPATVDRSDMRTHSAHLDRREGDAAGLPLGRWAITEKQSGQVIGGVALLPLPPERTDLEIGWQVAPAMRGLGTARRPATVAHQAFEKAGLSEVFAVARPATDRAVATARRVGMEWVGETSKYYGLYLQVYRLRKADLDLPEPGLR